MSLKDILDSVTGGNKALKPTESAPPAALPSDSFPILRASEVDLEKYEKLPLSGLAALGAAFATLPEAARTIVQTVTTGVDTGEMLFTAINPKGATGFLRMGEYGTSGRIVNSKGRYTGSLYFKPVENVPLMQTTTTVMPFDPATVAVAVALMRIEEKLDALQKTAEETLQFLKLDKQSKQRGNLNALSDIFEECRRNGNDASFRALRNVEVQAKRRFQSQNPNDRFLQTGFCEHAPFQAPFHVYDVFLQILVEEEHVAARHDTGRYRVLTLHGGAKAYHGGGIGDDQALEAKFLTKQLRYKHRGKRGGQSGLLCRRAQRPGIGGKGDMPGHDAQRALFNHAGINLSKGRIPVLY